MTPAELSAEDYVTYKRCVAEMQALFDVYAGRDRRIATLAVHKVAEKAQAASRVKVAANAKIEIPVKSEKQSEKNQSTYPFFAAMVTLGWATGLSIASLVQAVQGKVDDSITSGKWATAICGGALLIFAFSFYRENAKFRKPG